MPLVPNLGSASLWVGFENEVLRMTLDTGTSIRGARMRLARRGFHFARTIKRLASTWGFEPATLMSALKSRRIVSREYREFRDQQSQSRFRLEFPMGDRYRIYRDRYEEAGVSSGQYFHQDLLVARKIFNSRPVRHIDVGSSVYGFVSHVASFRTIEVLDVRAVTTPPEGIVFHQVDVMNLSEAWAGAADSVSCLHALEHFGLGRYGDPINSDGWFAGLLGLHRLCAPGGTLYLSVPTGAVQRVEFNAHRVFSLPFLRDLLLNYFDFLDLAFVKDDGSLVLNIDPYSATANASFGAQYGLSIWELRKSHFSGSGPSHGGE